MFFHIWKGMRTGRSQRGRSHHPTGGVFTVAAVLSERRHISAHSDGNSYHNCVFLRISEKWSATKKQMIDFSLPSWIIHRQTKIHIIVYTLANTSPI